MRARNPSIVVMMALGLLAPLAVGCADIPDVELIPQTVGKVDLGDYEVVENWPKPLPDDDLSHDGWTWGSGSGVWAESPDKVWVSQRAEIELPADAEPWTCACLLDPRRTNTGRRAYSGNDYGYAMRRHHIVFAVDRDGYVIEEWLQHDEFLAPSEGIARGPHKVLISPYDPEKHIWIVDDDLHVINKFTNDGELVLTMGERGVPGRGPNNFNRPTDMAWLPDGTFFVADGYAGTRVAKFGPDGNFLLDWGRPPVDPDNPGSYEFWSVHSIGISQDRLRLGGGLDDGPARQVRPGRALHPGHRGARPASRAVRWRAPDQCRPGGQPLRHRGRERPLAEVPSEAGRRSREAHLTAGWRLAGVGRDPNGGRLRRRPIPPSTRAANRFPRPGTSASPSQSL